MAPLPDRDERLMPIHSKDVCSGACPFHAPSDHVMKKWPTLVRASGLVERLCQHGVGHPDPDSVRWMDEHSYPGSRGTWGVHGCCGCCGAYPAPVKVPSYVEVRESACRAGSDGDCSWADCPQVRDGEPQATGRHCPLDFVAVATP